MNFSQLKYFAEVVRTKSLNQAAKNCYITYQAILKAMNSLEEELKTHLFNRSRSGVSLTANGEKFYEDVLQILELQKNWEKFYLSESVSINVLSSTTPCFTILNKVLPKMAQQYPNINLTYTPMLSKEIPESLLDPKKNFRIALTCRFPGHPDITLFAQEHHMECEYLYQATHCAVLSSKLVKPGQKTITVAELKEFPCVLSNSDYYDQYPFYSILNQEKVYRCFGADTLLQMVIAYNAVSTIDEHMTESVKEIYGDKIVMLPIEDYNSSLEYYIVYPKNSTANESLVVDYIKHFAEQYRK